MSENNATRQLAERRQSLAGTEQRIAGLIRFMTDGDSSEFVVTALRDLHGQLAVKRQPLLPPSRRAAHGAAPIELPRPLRWPRGP